MPSSPQTSTIAILVRGAEGSPPFSDELFCRRLSLESHRYNLNIIVLPISAHRDNPLPEKDTFTVTDNGKQLLFTGYSC